MILHAEYHKEGKRMKEKYSVFVSILHMDEYYSVESWPEEGSKAVILQGESIPGGSVSNAACVFSALGGRAAFYDVLSKSNTNDFLLNDLKKAGVCIDYVSRADGINDSKCLIICSENERTILYVKQPKPAIPLNEEQIELFRNADFIYLAGWNESLFPDYLHLFADFAAHGAKFAIDIEGSFPDDNARRIAEQSTVIFFNRFGYEANCDDFGNEKKLLDYFFTCGVEVIVITLGKDGCRVITKLNDYIIPAYDIKPIDTNGAGDTFNAAFLYGLSKKWQIKETAEFAIGAANRAITIKGARGGVASEETVRKFMRRYS